MCIQRPYEIVSSPHSATHSFSLSPSLSRSYFLSDFPVHALFRFILSLHRLHSLSLLSLSHDLSPVHYQFLCYCSLLIFVKVSLFLSLKFLSSYCHTVSLSLPLSVILFLSRSPPSHYLTHSSLTISPNSSLNFYLSHLNLSSHFVDLSFSLSSPVSLSSSLISLSPFSIFPPSIPFSFAIHKSFPPSLFCSLKHYFPS